MYKLLLSNEEFNGKRITQFDLGFESGVSPKGNKEERSKMAAGGLASKGAGLLKKPAFRIQATDVQTVALWGVAAGATAIWVVQPFDWIKKTFLEKPQPEEK